MNKHTNQRLAHQAELIRCGHSKTGYSRQHGFYVQAETLLTGDALLKLERPSPLKGVPRSHRKPISMPKIIGAKESYK